MFDLSEVVGILDMIFLTISFILKFPNFPGYFILFFSFKAHDKLDEIRDKITEEKLTIEDQKELYGAINAASAAQLRDGKILQEKMADGKHQPVIVRMYEELQERSTAMLVNVEPDLADKEFEDVRFSSLS